VKEMKENQVKVLVAANYFDETKVRSICERVGAIPVIVPMYVNGAPGTKDVFKLVDNWVDNLVKAFQQVEKETS
jgi:hypothetical protein